MEDQLSSTQLSNMKIAQQAIKSLPEGMHRIRSLAAASELPSSSMSLNAFSASYHFDTGLGKLYLRAERLDKVGEMLTIMAHANAHIQCGSMESDQVCCLCDVILIWNVGPTLPARVLLYSANSSWSQAHSSSSKFHSTCSNLQYT